MVMMVVMVMTTPLWKVLGRPAGPHGSRAEPAMVRSSLHGCADQRIPEAHEWANDPGHLVRWAERRARGEDVRDLSTHCCVWRFFEVVCVQRLGLYPGRHLQTQCRSSGALSSLPRREFPMGERYLCRSQKGRRALSTMAPWNASTHDRQAHNGVGLLHPGYLVEQR